MLGYLLRYSILFCQESVLTFIISFTGVLAFDSEAGFWLIHSVPMFPSNVSYFWPDNALSYGQSMLCVSFKSLLMEDIGKHFYLNFSRFLYV